jgi:hypothetical protein
LPPAGKRRLLETRIARIFTKSGRKALLLPCVEHAEEDEDMVLISLCIGRPAFAWLRRGRQTVSLA